MSGAFGLSSVLALKPEYGETVALQSSGIVMYPKGLVTARRLTLWVQTVDFGETLEVQSLGLPVNPNMRFFALTLE